MHMYTNMDSIDDIEDNQKANFKDIEVPIVRCEGSSLAWREDNLKYYCTEFTEDHFIYGGFYGAKFSWLRLILHHCDRSEGAREERIA